MKQFFYIVSMIIVYFLLTAKGCGGDTKSASDVREQKRIETEIDSLAEIFGSESLSPFALLAFEENAKIRFNDFLDYFGIAADSTKAKAFKEQAGRMIGDMFISRDCILCFKIADKNAVTGITVKELVAANSGFLKYISILHPDSLWITEKLKPVNDTMYAGQLGFSMDMTSYQREFDNYYPGCGVISFYIVKQRKVFGKDTLNIWSVLLGENNISR
jgi:hypothetical protein